MKIRARMDKGHRTLVLWENYYDNSFNGYIMVTEYPSEFPWNRPRKKKIISKTLKHRVMT